MAKDWTVSLDVPDEVYTKWRQFNVDRGAMYVGNKSPMRKIHSKLMVEAITILMNSSPKKIEAFFKQFED